MKKLFFLVLATLIVGGLLVHFGETIESQFLYATSNEGFLATTENESGQKAEPVEFTQAVESKETALKSEQTKEETVKTNVKQSEANKPKMTVPEGTTEIPFNEGDLKVERSGKDVIYTLNGKEFASGVINPDGSYYISHHYKTERAQWARAFSTARVNLHRLSEGKQMKPNILEDF